MKTAVTVKKNLPAVTDSFPQLATIPTSPISEAHMKPGSNCLHRKAEHMMLSIPPKRAALLQHINRAAYQADHALLGPSAFTKPRSTYTRGLGMDF